MTTKNKEKCSAPIRVEDQSRSRHSLVSVSCLSSILSFTIPVKQLCHSLSWSKMRSDSWRRSPPTVFHFSDLRHRPGEWKSGGDSAACVQRKVSDNWIFDTCVCFARLREKNENSVLKIYILHFDSQESWPPPQPEADGERTNSEGDKVRFSFFLARKKQRKKWGWQLRNWHRVITDQYRMIKSSREWQCDK